MTEKEYPFKVIDGKKENFSDRSQRLQDIQNRIAKQDALSPKEKLDLLKDMSQERLVRIKEGVLAYSGKMLSDKEARFIDERSLSLARGNEAVYEEVCKRFPDLRGYFDALRVRMLALEEQKERTPSFVQIEFFGVGRDPVRLTYNPTTASIEFAEGISIDGKTYRIQGKGFGKTNDGASYKILHASTPEFFQSTARGAYSKEPFFEVIDVSPFVKED